MCSLEASVPLTPSLPFPITGRGSSAVGGHDPESHREFTAWDMETRPWCHARYQQTWDFPGCLKGILILSDFNNPRHYSTNNLLSGDNQTTATNPHPEPKSQTPKYTVILWAFPSPLDNFSGKSSVLSELRTKLWLQGASGKGVDLSPYSYPV